MATPPQIVTASEAETHQQEAARATNSLLWDGRKNSLEQTTQLDFPKTSVFSIGSPTKQTPCAHTLFAAGSNQHGWWAMDNKERATEEIGRITAEQ